MVLTVSLLLFALVLAGKLEAQTATNPLTSKEKISYALGYLNGKSAALGDYEAFYESINIKPYLKGFKENIKSPDLVDSCNEILNNPYIQVGDSVELMDLSILSECQGRFLGATFCGQIMDEKLENEIDLDQFYAGFEQNILQLDPAFPEEEMQMIVAEFSEFLSKREEQKMVENDAKLLERTAAWKKPKKLENGIIVHTLIVGKGKSNPTAADDIIANYSTLDNEGNQTESTFESGAPMIVNLANLIEGWKLGIVEMQKGGKYELYLPSKYAYNQGSLIFTIELIDFGPAGTIVKDEENGE